MGFEQGSGLVVPLLSWAWLSWVSSELVHSCWPPLLKGLQPPCTAPCLCSAEGPGGQCSPPAQTKHGAGLGSKLAPSQWPPLPPLSQEGMCGEGGTILLLHPTTAEEDRPRKECTNWPAVCYSQLQVTPPSFFLLCLIVLQ